MLEIWAVLAPTRVTIIKEPGSSEDSGSDGVEFFTML